MARQPLKQQEISELFVKWEKLAAEVIPEEYVLTTIHPDQAPPQRRNQRDPSLLL